jgi:hypothetical protein
MIGRLQAHVKKSLTSFGKHLCQLHTEKLMVVRAFKRLNIIAKNKYNDRPIVCQGLWKEIKSSRKERESSVEIDIAEIVSYSLKDLCV